MKLSGNLGEQVGAEIKKAFKNSLGGYTPKNPLTKMTKVRLAKSDTTGSTKGPDTVGGVVGGLADKANYHGVQAGK